MMDNIKPYKPRKSHRKSRNGCKNCRRRKIKCDETKPECRTCVIREEQCEYFPHTWQSYAPEDNHSDTLLNIHAENFAPTNESPRNLTPSVDRDDMYLLDQFLEHASDAHGVNPGHNYARKVGLPKMAAENQGLLCTLLSIGAASLAIDLLRNCELPTHMDQIANLICKGDRYHATALASLHSKLADGSRDLEIAHAQSAIVFGYSAGRRRIFRLLHRQQQNLEDAPEPEADLPSNLEWMHLLRGVRTIGQAISNSDGSARSPSSNNQAPQDPYIIAYIHQAIDSIPQPSPDDIKAFSDGHTAPRHGLTLWVSSTIKPALQSLHTDLDDFYRRFRADHDSSNDPLSAYAHIHAELDFETLQSLAACRSALSALDALSNVLFHTVSGSAPSSTSTSPASATSSPIQETSLQREPTIDWRKSYLSPASFGTSEPLARGILAWTSRISAPFVVLLTSPPAIRSRPVAQTSKLHSPTPDKVSPEHEMALFAWNIYAHWAALTILIEDECWWWGDLGLSDIAHLEGLLAPAQGNYERQQAESREWWPGVVRKTAEAFAAGHC